MKRSSATEAPRSFSRVLDPAEHGGETRIDCPAFAELRPALKHSTVGDLGAFLRDVPLPDSDFRSDMLEIVQQSSRDVASDPWV